MPDASAIRQNNESAGLEFASHQRPGSVFIHHGLDTDDIPENTTDGGAAAAARHH